MLQVLQIKNFQSHKETYIELSPGVTLITGTSNNGKTAILRALNWIVTNRPLGDSFIRHGEDCCDVVLQSDKGSVRRIRSSKENTYIVGSHSVVSSDLDNLDPVKDNFIQFRAMGSEVPKEVTDLLNMASINIQQQLDPYFLVLDSPGRIGSYFNSIIHLDEVEKIVEEINKRARLETNVVKNLIDQEVEVKENISFYESLGLDTFELILEKYDVVKNSISMRKSGNDLLSRLIVELKDIESQIVVLPDISSILKSAEVLPIEISYLKYSINNLRDFIDDYGKLDRKLLPCSSFSIIEEVDLQIQYIEKLDTSLDSLFVLIEQLEKVEKEEQVLNDAIEEQTKLYSSLLKELNVCPHCGNKLDATHKRLLLEQEKIDGYFS